MPYKAEHVDDASLLNDDKVDNLGVFLDQLVTVMSLNSQMSTNTMIPKWKFNLDTPIWAIDQWYRNQIKRPKTYQGL